MLGIRWLITRKTKVLEVMEEIDGLFRLETAFGDLYSRGNEDLIYCAVLFGTIGSVEPIGD